MTLSKKDIQKLNVYIHGWKGLAKYFDKSVRTLQRWDAEVSIPWEKKGKRKQDPVRIHVLVADEYFKIFKS